MKRSGCSRPASPCVQRRAWRRRSWRYWYSCRAWRSEEHTSELQSLMRNSYAVLCLKKKKKTKKNEDQKEKDEKQKLKNTIRKTHMKAKQTIRTPEYNKIHKKQKLQNIISHNTIRTVTANTLLKQNTETSIDK